MTSYEIIKAALHGTRPERMPVRMSSLGVDDTGWVDITTTTWTDRGGYSFDEWGCGWEHSSVPNMGQVRSHAIADLSEQHTVTVPDYTLSQRFEKCSAQLDRHEREGKYTQVGIFAILFERMHMVAGFENVLTGLYTDPENAGLLADKIVDAHITLVRECQKRMGSRLHSFSMTEDWGTQHAAFVDMATWRSFFLPRYRRIFDAMHSGGQDVWVHSCGRINEVIEGFIEAGVDAVNLQQPRALGIEEIGQRYRGRIAFESLADIQHTLPSGNRDAIENDAVALGKHWMSPEGGFIFSDYGDGAAIGVPPETKTAMYRAFSRVSERVYGNPLPELACP